MWYNLSVSLALDSSPGRGASGETGDVAGTANGSPFGRAGNANALTERVRKSASPCRLGKRFFCPVQDRVNDKKVNEENSNIN